MLEPVKPFIAVFSKFPELIEETVKKYSFFLGQADLKSDLYEVNTFTSYYEKEMGNNLQKGFFSFQKLIDPYDIVKLKLISNEIEKNTCDIKSRKINTDPGYLCPSKVILSSHKDSAQRIYLGSSVFAEITLVYRKNEFNHFEYTYPDYRSPIATRFFSAMRQIYKSQISNKTFSIADIKFNKTK